MGQDQVCFEANKGEKARVCSRSRMLAHRAGRRREAQPRGPAVGLVALSPGEEKGPLFPREREEPCLLTPGPGLLRTAPPLAFVLCPLPTPLLALCALQVAPWEGPPRGLHNGAEVATKTWAWRPACEKRSAVELCVSVLPTAVSCADRAPDELHCGRTYSCSSRRPAGRTGWLPVCFPRALILDAVYTFTRLDSWSGSLISKQTNCAALMKLFYQPSSELEAWRCSWVKFVCDAAEQKLAAWDSALNSIYTSVKGLAQADCYPV